MTGKRQILREAGELDQRRQVQIQRQKESINRLLEGRDGAEEISQLNEELSSYLVREPLLQEIVSELGKRPVKELTRAERAFLVVMSDER